MSTRKPRNQKSNRKRLKSGKPNDEAKIFVLTPNILEKLGIDLGPKTNENQLKDLADSCNTEITAVNLNSPIQQKSRKRNESNELSTSLSETATLMKNSVLLSPTFSHNAIEATSSKDFINTLNVDSVDSSVDSYLNGTKKEVELIMFNKNQDLSKNINNEYSIEPYVESTITTPNISRKEDTNTSSDGQNNNSQPNLISDNTGIVSDFVFKVPYPQVVNVIGSEVTLNNSEQNKNKLQLNNCVIPSQSNNYKFKQVVSTAASNMQLVSNGPIKEAINLQDHNIIQTETNPTTCDKDGKELHQNDSIAIKDNSCKISADKAKCPLYTSLVDITSHVPTQRTDQISEKIIEVQNSILNNNVATNNNANDDRVKEITEYLSKCSKIAMHTKRTMVMSKSTIQGVEKPGGILEVNRSGGRTYKGKNKHATKKHGYVINHNSEIDPVPESQNIDYAELPAAMNENFYCNCSDFGTFMDVEESIHFCNKPSLHIQKEVLYEMYNDEDANIISKPLDKDDSFVDITALEMSELLSPICWNVYGSIENNLNDKMSVHVEKFYESNDTNLNYGDKKMNTFNTEPFEKTNLSSNVQNTNELNTINPNIMIPTSQETDHSECLKKAIKSSKNNVNSDVPKLDYTLVGCTEILPQIKTSNTKSTSQNLVSTEPNVVPELDKKDNTHKLDQKDKSTKIEGIKQTKESESNIEKSGKKRKNSFENVAPTKKSLKCDVCTAMLADNEWNLHAEEEHCHIAWPTGEDFNTLFNKNLRVKLEKKLQNLGVLKCTFCNVEIKEVRRFIRHIKKCKISKDLGNTDENDLSDDFPEEEEQKSLSELKQLKHKENELDDSSSKPTVKCGVCFMETSDWIDHICKEHKYIAWKDGETPLECCDENDARQCLKNVLREIEELVCYKCGSGLKQARAYLKHIKTCDENISFNFTTVSDINTSQELNTSSNIKCGVCAVEVNDKDWIEHITKEHQYMAWKDGEEPLDQSNEEQIRLYLHSILKQIGCLKCSKCGLVRKYAKSYLTHIKECTVEFVINSSSVSNTSITKDTIATTLRTPGLYKCGVCSKEGDNKHWIEHISSEHEYIAWKEGDKPLNTEDKEQIREYLHNITKLTGGLKCSKCGIIRKYAKMYMNHIESCTGKIDKDDSDSDNDLPEEVRCGVCKLEMKRDQWISHIEEKHNYLAWWDVEDPLNLDNDEEVLEHLRQILYSNGGLKCMKCDYVSKKFPKRFLNHIKTIDCTKYEPVKPLVKKEVPVVYEIKRVKGEILECARCHQKVKESDWEDHAMREHYNVAWAIGDTPIDIRNQNSVDRLLKTYLKKKKSYTCKVCGITRVSSYGFYAHIIVCGKTDEETEIYKELCHICNEKYLCVYRSQHMTAHKESVLAKQRRVEMQERNQKVGLIENVGPELVSGKRQAAQKAISVIGNLTKGDNTEKTGDFSDSDESVKLDIDALDTEESESDVDSNISDQEYEQRAIMAISEKAHRGVNDVVEYAKILPFDVSDKRSFVMRSARDFAEAYCTKDVLFPKWLPSSFEVLDEDKASEYLPKLEHSCLIHYDDNVVSMKRFESVTGHTRATYSFVGGTVRQVCWLPVNLNEQNENYLSVVCHNGGDAPRHNDDEIVSGPGSMQIWNCGTFNRLPELSTVIVHDYGVVWSICWCPSGARDSLANTKVLEHSNLRLGLVAAACSNGQVYIFSVPYPAMDSKMQYMKLKPVAELRMASNQKRRKFQATAVNWTRDKGHDTILVGYSDGTLCYYNISSNSPILTSSENGVDIFYPYNEIKAQSACITGVGSFPEAGGSGALCVGSMLGTARRAGGAGAAGAGAGAGGAAGRTHYAVENMFMSHHWPAPYISGETCLINASAPNEIELWGNMRRFGLVHTMTECKCCGLVAIFTSSQIRLMRAYPACTDIRKVSVLSIDVKHLAKKSKIKTDNLGVVVEPLTYEDAVQKYGLTIKRFTSKSVIPPQQRAIEVCIERFPLNTVTSMEFCSTGEFHNKLAVGLQAGVLIIMSVL